MFDIPLGVESMQMWLFLRNAISNINPNTNYNRILPLPAPAAVVTRMTSALIDPPPPSEVLGEIFAVWVALVALAVASHSRWNLKTLNKQDLCLSPKFALSAVNWFSCRLFKHRGKQLLLLLLLNPPMQLYLIVFMNPIIFCKLHKNPNFSSFLLWKVFE